MRTQKELIEIYEKRLETVKKFWSDCQKGVAYIEHAKESLEEVKNGRRW